MNKIFEQKLTKMKTFILLTTILNVLTIDAMDPEIALCKELKIDAAVIADDNIGYAFKGDFHWTMDYISGISQHFVAKHISDRWEGLTGPIDAVFTIDESKYGLTTVFIKGNQWYLYQRQKLKATNTTDNWPYVFKKRMLSAFEYFDKQLLRKDIGVYLMYGDEDVSKYVFHDIYNPTHVHNGKAYRLGRFLSFLKNEDISPQLLSTYIQPLAVMSNDEGIVIYGDRAICFAEKAEYPLCNKTTDTALLTKYYGCPRNPLPTTTTIRTTTSTTPTTRLTTKTKATTTPHLPPSSTKVTDLTNTPKTDSTTTEFIPTVLSSGTTEQTLETITSTEEQLTTSKSPIIKETKTYGTDKGLKSPTNSPKPKKKTSVWVYIAVIVIIVIICLIILFVVIFSVYKIRSNKNKRTTIRDTKDIVVGNTDKSKKNVGRVGSGSGKSLSDKSLSGLRSPSTVSVRSQMEDPIKDPSDEEIFSKIDGKTSSNIEADEILDAIKTNEGID